MHRLSAALTCAAIVLLAACTTTEPSPAPLPETSVGSTTDVSEVTATSTPDDAVQTNSPGAGEDPGVPEMPAEAMEDTEAGAEAFVKYYIDIVNYTGRYPRAGLLDSLAKPECETCDNLEQVVYDLIDSNKHYDGDNAVVQEIEALPSEGGYRVFMSSASPSYKIIGEAQGAPEDVTEGPITEVVFKLATSDTGFLVEWIKSVEA